MLTHAGLESRADSKRAEVGGWGDIKINKVCKLVSKRVFRQAETRGMKRWNAYICGQVTPDIIKRYVYGTGPHSRVTC